MTLRQIFGHVRLNVFLSLNSRSDFSTVSITCTFVLTVFTIGEIVAKTVCEKRAIVSKKIPSLTVVTFFVLNMVSKLQKKTTMFY